MKSRFPWLLALSVFILINAALVLRWARQDTRPLAWDEAVHTRNTLEYRDRLKDGSFLDLMRPVYFNYPPLYNFSVIPFLDRVPDIVDAGAVANVFYLSLLVFLTYLIGARLLDRPSGFAAALLVGAYPLILHIARQTMLDLALTMWVTGAFYALLRSEDFSRRFWAAAFGVLLGLGMLTKWTAAAYLVGPLLPVTWACLRRRTFKGPLIALVAFIVTILPWYALNVVPMLARIAQVSDLAPAGGMEFSGLAKALWYPLALFEQIQGVFVLLFVVGLPFAIRRRELRPALLWLFVSMLLFSLIRNNNVRYMMPALPAVAIVSAAVVAGRRWAIAPVVVLALGFFVAFNFAAIAPVKVNAGNFPLTLFARHVAHPEDWKHREIIHRIQELKSPDGFSRVIVLSNGPFFHSTTMNITLRGEGIENFSFRGPSKSERWLDFAEFIVMKTGDLGPEFSIKTIKRHVDWIATAPAWFSKSYKEAGRWSLPDGSEAILLHAAPDPIPASANEMMSVTLGEASLPNLELRGVGIRADARSPQDTAVGRLARLTVKARSVEHKGLALEDVELDFIRPQINVPRYRETSEIQLLSLDRLSARATLNASTLLAYAARKAKWLKDPGILFNDDVVLITGKAGGSVPIRIEASIEADSETLRPRLQSIHVFGLPLPVVFLRALSDRPVPLSPNRETPFQIDLGRIVGSGDQLKVGLK